MMKLKKQNKYPWFNAIAALICIFLGIKSLIQQYILKSYIDAYIVIPILVMALGIMLLCRPVTKPIKANKIVVIIAIVIAVGIIIWPWAKPRTTTYCHYEQNITNSSLERFECVNMKIISRSKNAIDMEGFMALDLSNQLCSDSYDDMPECIAVEFFNGGMYFSKYPMSSLCDGCRLDGVLCAESFVTFYTFDNATYELYKDRFVSEEITEGYLHEKFEECGVKE